MIPVPLALVSMPSRAVTGSSPFSGNAEEGRVSTQTTESRR